jgi:hypothetical protein
MIIAYTIVGPDNDSYIFDPDDVNVPKCQKCGCVTDYDYISPNMVLNIKKFDISCTYDNRYIVSRKFKEFCEKNKYTNIDFFKLPHEINFFKLRVNNLISEDLEKKKLRYEKYCDICQRYESVIPAYPIILKNNKEVLKEGFYASDIFIGNGNGKINTYFIGIETFTKMKKEKFKGIYFKKVET